MKFGATIILPPPMRLDYSTIGSLVFPDRSSGISAPERYVATVSDASWAIFYMSVALAIKLLSIK